MGYNKEERLAIGKQLYTGEISLSEAMKKYDICRSSAKSFVTQYKRANEIPIRKHTVTSHPKTKASSNTDLERYQSMSKEELINELIKAKANELRAKKGYEVKGVGANKEFIPLNNKNSK